MEHGKIGLDARLQELVDELDVKADAVGVDLARAVRQESGPVDGEAIGLEPHLLHERDVLAEAVIMIAPYTRGVLVKDEMSVLAGGIPDAFTLAALISGAFDLVGGCRRPPDKI